MKTIGLFFGTDTGNTETIADKLVDKFAAAGWIVDLFDVDDVRVEDFKDYKFIVLGHPTWYYGELQSSWEGFWEEFKEVDFSNKIIACYGLGDQYDYADYFLDAMGLMHDIAVANGAYACGYTAIEGYEHTASKAQKNLDGKEVFLGLGLDEDQQPELTETRLNAWVQQVVKEFEAKL